MESAYLKRLSDFFQKYNYLLIYGAGGVTKDLLLLLEPCLYRDRTFIVVSEMKGNESRLGGYSVREISEFCHVSGEAYVIVSAAPRYVPRMKEHLNELGFEKFCTSACLFDEIYKEIWEKPLINNKIMLANGDGYGFGGNPKYIALELLESGKNLELVWTAGCGGLRMPAGVRTVRYGTYEYYYELGTAKIWIDNQHKNFFTRKRKGQIYIQTWHGGGPLKKIEFDAEGLSSSYLDLCEMNSELEDLMISPTRFNSELYRRAFHYQGEILECGYPRNDIFWKSNQCRKSIERLYGIGETERIVLFAPTYREFDAEERDILDLKKVRHSLEKRFGERVRILVRFHPFDKEPEKSYIESRDCINATSYDDVQELLMASDILITDYSSVMWDFSLQKKPVFLFHPDIKRYEKERGYYLTFKEMPYIEAFSSEEMCKNIEEFREDIYEKTLTKFLEDYGSFDNGIASKVISDRILEMMEA